MKIKAKDYFDDDKNILKIGDVIKLSNTHKKEKDGTYIIFSDEKCGTWLRGMCPVETKKTTSHGKEHNYIAGYTTQGIQNCDKNAQIEILGNILEDYKVNKLKNNMNTISQKIRKITRKDPEKTFIEVGFMNDNEEITSEGLEALNYILWNEKKDELKKLAEQIKEETKK